MQLTFQQSGAEFNPLSDAVVSAGYAKSRAGAARGHDPNKFDWPTLLRKLDRIDPTYKESASRRARGDGKRRGLLMNASATTESLWKHMIKPLLMLPALILTACGVEPTLPGPVMWEEVGNFQDLAQFDRVPPSRQVPPFRQVANFDRSAYKGPLGIDLAMDISNVVEELRGSRIDFVARYYREPTSSLPALSSQEAQKLASLGLKIVAVWEQNSPDPENLSYSSGYKDAIAAYEQASAIGQPTGSAIYFAIDFNAHELGSAQEYFRGIAAGLTAASGGRAKYKVGVYGSGAVCDAIKRAGLAQYSWLTKAASWDGSLDYNNCDIKQGPALPFSFDNDSDEARGDYGGFRLREL